MDPLKSVKKTKKPNIQQQTFSDVDRVLKNQALERCKDVNRVTRPFITWYVNKKTKQYPFYTLRSIVTSQKMDFARRLHEEGVLTIT